MKFFVVIVVWCRKNLFFEKFYVFPALFFILCKMCDNRWKKEMVKRAAYLEWVSEIRRIMVMANSSCKFCYLKSSFDIQEQSGGEGRKFFMAKFIVFGVAKREEREVLVAESEALENKIKCGECCTSTTWLSLTFTQYNQVFFDAIWWDFLISQRFMIWNISKVLVEVNPFALHIQNIFKMKFLSLEKSSNIISSLSTIKVSICKHSSRRHRENIRMENFFHIFSNSRIVNRNEKC